MSCLGALLAVLRRDLSVYSIILSTGRTYGRFVVVVPEEEGAFVETEQELMVRSSLSRSIYQQLMMREDGNKHVGM